jgi:RNA polymerase sigma-70 factor (sigma-E family)
MDGDREFSAYAAAQWPTLVRAAVFLGCTIDDAHDLAQTTLLRCHQAWGKVSQAEDPDAYVYRILLNCFRDGRRRRWRGEQPTATVPDDTVPDTTAEVDTADAVHRALGHLSTSKRQVVVLRYYAHLTQQQTADVLGISPGTVKSRLSRALKELAANPHLTELAERTQP